MNSYTDILIDKPADALVVITLNRPKARNALRTHLLEELVAAIDKAQADDSIRCLIISGSEKVFAAGADVAEMAKMDQAAIKKDRRPELWQKISNCTKPIIASVNGFALGGGCELAMHADIIIAGTNAQFGQPEINLGIIPGAGGTQRLIRAVGKALAAKMILTGEFIDAKTAISAGLVAEITQPELTLKRAIQLGKLITQKSPLAIAQAKQALLNAFELPLGEGLKYEREAFIRLSGSKDRDEGLSAFLEKRKPHFSGE